MLDYVGAKSLADLMEKALPEAIHYRGGSKLPEPLSEDEALERLREIASKNRITQSFIGLGYYGTRTPGLSSAMFLRTQAGTPPTPPINRRSVRVAWKH